MKNMRFIWLVVVGLSVFVLCSSSTANIVPTAVTKVKKTITALKKVHVNSNDPSVPKNAIPLLKNLKEQLCSLMLEKLDNTNFGTLGIKELKSNFISSLKKEGIKVERPTEQVIDDINSVPDYYQYGDVYDMDFQVIPGYQNLVVATSTISVCCGEDTSLYFFSKDRGQWRVVFTDVVNDYKIIAKAPTSFGYGFVKSEDGKNLFLVTAKIEPWCQSNWRAIDYDIYRISLKDFQNKKILSKNATIYLGVKPPVYKLSVEKNGFSLSFWGGRNMADVNEDGTAKHQTIRYDLIKSHFSLASDFK